MFEKLDEYLVSIYMNQELDNNFFIFKMNNKKNYSIKGFLEDSNEPYSLYRKDNKLGLKINDGQYMFLYSREKYVDSQEFNTIAENDFEYDEDELRENFKDVDYVVFEEYDKTTKNGQKISFLVNKSSYLVTSYFRVYEDGSNVLVSYDSDLLNSEELTKLHILDPLNPNFNIKNQDKENIVVLIADNFHENFTIKENLRDTNNLFFRRCIVKKMSNEAVEADRKSYTIINDFDECAKRLNEILNKRFSNDLESR